MMKLCDEGAKISSYHFGASYRLYQVFCFYYEREEKTYIQSTILGAAGILGAMIEQ